jgi:hypothetical protein
VTALSRSQRAGTRKSAAGAVSLSACRLQFAARMKNRPRLRRARPLLIAGAAITALAAAIGCPGPFGNLKAPDGGFEPPDMANTDGFFGNLRAPIDMAKPDHD